MTITPEHLDLGGLITTLETENPERVIPVGFHKPCSYRGDYSELAFELAHDISIGEMLAAARSALSATYQGWKGGDYTMGEYTLCWLVAHRGDEGESIGRLLLATLLATPDTRAEQAEAALARAEQDLAAVVTARPGLRPWTPDRRIYGGITLHVKRACNGCGHMIGDVTDADFPTDPITGEFTDVRLECPICLPAILAQIREEVGRWAGFDLARNITAILDTGHGERQAAT